MGPGAIRCLARDGLKTPQTRPALGQDFLNSLYGLYIAPPRLDLLAQGLPRPPIVSATAGAARSAVAGSFHTCLAEHRARATGVSLSHRPDELLFNNSATRALYDQDVHLREASACQRVRIKVVRVVSETLLRDQDSKA